jgi:hypothetical protein
VKAPRLVGGPRSEPAWLYALAGVLLLAGPVGYYLYVERYPLRGELVLLVGAPALAGALVALLANRIEGIVGGVAFGGLVFLFLDLQFPLEDHVRMAVPLTAALAFALLLRRRRAAITCVSLGAFFLSGLTQRTPADSSPTTKTLAEQRPGLPVVLHIILDEQLGIGGLRMQGDSATADSLTDFYLRRGFEVYESAYSRYFLTMESVPALVSLGQRTPRQLTDGSRSPRRDFRFWLRANPYFEQLRSRGYVIRVFQSRFLDFCATPGVPIASCESYSGNSIANIGRLNGLATTRARFAARFYLNLNSRVYTKLRTDGEAWSRATLGGGLVSLRHLRDAIANGPRSGVAYFVHVMAPHRPLEVDAECRLVKDLGKRVPSTQPTQFSDSSWDGVRKRLSDQILCVQREVGAVLNALDRVVGQDKAIVLIQGDHGSRLYQRVPKQGASPSQLDDRQLGERYATLLAVRRPGVPPRMLAEPVPVQDFVWRIVRQDFRGPVALDFEQYVRASSMEAVRADSIRMLAPGKTPWAR